jgi:ribonuclease G
VRKIGADLDGRGVVVRVNPDIARALREEEAGVLRELKETLRKEVALRADALLHHEQFDVMAM